MTDTTDGDKLIPPSIKRPNLLESSPAARMTTTDETAQTPFSPDHMEREIHKGFRRQKGTHEKSQKSETSEEEFVSKLISESEDSLSPPPANNLGLPPLNRFSVPLRDKKNLRIRSLGRDCSSPSSSHRKSVNRRSARVSPSNTLLLKESFKNQFQRQHQQQLQQYREPSPQIEETKNVSENRFGEVTASESDAVNDDYDSDYWEDDRWMLIWEARRLGLIYFGMEELEKHRKATALSQEERMQFLMK